MLRPTTPERSTSAPSTGNDPTDRDPPDTAGSDPGPPPLERMPRSVRRAALAGGACSLIAFAWLVTAGTFSLFELQPRAGDFYEAQARSFLAGRWAIEPGVLGIEAFEIDGEEHTYFGIVPTLARLPIVAMTDALDGRLTQTSMLLAAAVTLAAASSASWTVRCSVRGAAAVDRADLIIAAVVPLVVGSGSLVHYLAARAWVYHEAVIWGIALSVVSAAALIRHLLDGRDRSLVVSGIAAIAAIHTRAAVGAGAVAMVALVAVVEVLSWCGDRQLRRRGDAARHGWVLLAGLSARVAVARSSRRLAIATMAVLVAVVGYVGVNQARFGEPLRLPYETQTYVRISPERQAVLAENGGSFFGLRFVPTTALNYVRPDAISLGRTFPFIGFGPPATVIGDVRFDTIDPTASTTASMPALSVGAVAGVVLVVQAVRRRSPLRIMALPTAGAAVGALACLTIGYIAHRYQGDALPFLVIATLPVLHRIPLLGRRTRRVAVGAAALLVIGSIVANSALGLLYQRQVAPDVPDALRAALVRDQLRADRLVPFARPPAVRWGDSLPAVVGQGEIFGLDDCAGLYWGSGDRWRGIERTPITGGWTFDVTWPTDAVDPQPLLSSGGPGTANVLVAVPAEDGTMRVGYVWDDPDAGRQQDLGRPFDVGATSRVEVVFDPVTVEIRVVVDGRLVLEGFRFLPTPGEVVGRSLAGGTIADEFAGEIVVVPREPSTCRALAERTSVR